MKARIIKVGQVYKDEAGYRLEGWEFAVTGLPQDYAGGDAWGYSFEELRQLSWEHSPLHRLEEDLRRAADHCPNCHGTRQWVYTYRGRDNLVPCPRCEPVFKLLETLAPALELRKGDFQY
jgi:hypothetical protein